MFLDRVLESLTPDTIKGMITINSLDKADVRLREMILEKAASTPLTHEVFLCLLSKHEIRYNQQNKTGSVKRVGSRISGKASERLAASSSREEIQEHNNPKFLHIHYLFSFGGLWVGGCSSESLEVFWLSPASPIAPNAVSEAVTPGCVTASPVRTAPSGPGKLNTLVVPICFTGFWQDSY